MTIVECAGDFGEQNVELVRAVSELPLPKAVILGNHDAWLPFGPKEGVRTMSSSLLFVLRKL